MRPTKIISSGRISFNSRSSPRPPIHCCVTKAIVVVPADFSPTSDHALGYAWSLTRALPIRVHLVHAVPRAFASAESAARTRLAALRPADLGARVEIHVVAGDAAEAIFAHLDAVKPAFAVLGEHARDLLCRAFTRDTTLRVVHGASCPVWVVPLCATM